MELMLWEILRDLQTDKYPVGTRFKSLAPCWQPINDESECYIEVIGFGVDLHTGEDEGKTLKWGPDHPTNNRSANNLLKLSGASVGWKWVIMDGPRTKGEESKR